jgi:hypothetical protein
MKGLGRIFAASAAFVLGLILSEGALAQKQGGILRVFHRESPASMRQGTCWQPEVKGLTLMENSIFNSWRMEDVWLEKQ